MTNKKQMKWIMLLIAMICSLSGCGRLGSEYLINVSYDPTRELYEQYNELFTNYIYETTGKKMEIIQSHGGSGKQALEVANGLEADVVTLALESDIQEIAKEGLIEEGFTKKFPKDSAPYTSSIVFLVRKGNPKEITDWNDLLREDVGIITPNPKTSGGARWNYLAAWYYFECQGYEENEIIEKMKTLYLHVKVLDSGARASTTSFVENGQGDVLITWENEAFFTLQSYPQQYEIVVPSVSVLCQPTVAIVDEIAKKHGTTQLAQEYLSYLYEKDAQRLIGKNYYRPIDEEIEKEFLRDNHTRVITEIPDDDKWIVSDIQMADINHFGGWKVTTEKHFSDGGYFDRIYE